MRYFLRHNACADLTGGKASACLRRRHAAEFQKGQHGVAGFPAWWGHDESTSKSSSGLETSWRNDHNDYVAIAAARAWARVSPKPAAATKDLLTFPSSEENFLNTPWVPLGTSQAIAAIGPRNVSCFLFFCLCISLCLHTYIYIHISLCLPVYQI